ncbi:hypothetical protein GC096_03855 [Paenibacillus sp. LMG 31461]|uniref:Phage tail tape measure protein domain-containing protein n=1 Tax=Paenibacillus plantarum TaxID=2654975 RepID=A0ABX1X444_9BACL|nr:phage tail tape measure protein [Paenibacillus plantarum]NOU63180.1 hypothetical protein [Paenibacillus plantarum]
MEIFKLFGSIFIRDEEAQERIEGIDESAGGLHLTLGKIVKAAAALGGAIVAGLAVGSVIEGVNDLQKAVADFQSSTGSSNDEMVEFKDTLTDIYDNNYGESFDDIAKSMANLRQTTGASGEELKNLTQNALMLRDTFEFEVNDSINAANSLMKTFGINGDEAYTLIAQGAQNGANKNGDLLDTLNEYSPQFKALGFSANQFTDILIQGAANGAFSIDKVGDSIKEFNIRAKDGSDSSKSAFEKLGLNADALTKSFANGGKSAQESFGQVVSALSKLEDPILKNQIGVSLFGTQFEDLEATAITSLANVESKANMAADTLDQINQAEYKTFTEAMQGIGRNIQTSLIVPLSEKVLPLLMEFSGWVTSKTPEIKEAVSGAINVAIEIFERLSTTIEWVIGNLNLLLPAIVGVTAVIAAQSIINTVVSLYKAWQLATATMTTAQWLLNAAMSANPIGLVALAVGALIAAGVALYMNWDKVTALLSASWEWMKKTAIDVFTVISVKVTEVWDSVKQITIETWNSITEFFTKDIPAAFNTVVGFFAELPGRIYTFLVDLYLVKIPYAIGYGIGWMIKAASEGIPKLIQFFENLPGQIWEWLVKVYTNFQTWHDNMRDKAIEVGSSVIKGVIDFFAELPGKVWNWLVQVVTKMSEWQTNANLKAKEAGQSIVDSIINFIKELPSKISKWFTDTVTGIVDFGTEAYTAAGDFGKNIVDGIVDFIKNIPTKIEEYVGGAVSRVMGYATKVKDLISGIFKSGSEGVQAGMGKSGYSATISIPAFATGTNSAPGGLSLVGEEGPELVNLPRGAQVYTHEQSKNMVNSSPEYVVVKIHLDSKEIAQVIAVPMNQELNGIVNSAMREIGL